MRLLLDELTTLLYSIREEDIVAPPCEPLDGFGEVLCDIEDHLYLQKLFTLSFILEGRRKKMESDLPAKKDLTAEEKEEYIFLATLCQMAEDLFWMQAGICFPELIILELREKVLCSDWTIRGNRIELGESEEASSSLTLAPDGSILQ